jgi:hypothetical protein
LKDPIDRMTGQPQVDDKNPNPALRTRPVIGISPVHRHAPVGAGQMVRPDLQCRRRRHLCQPRSYDGSDALRVEGCVGMICGGETWTRVGR